MSVISSKYNHRTKLLTIRIKSGYHYATPPTGLVMLAENSTELKKKKKKMSKKNFESV